VLKHMFSLEELKEKATLLLDLKEDVREECEKLGEVTNVVLYDLEPEGIMTVRFKSEASARQCINTLGGRYFGGRTVKAALFDGSRKFKKTGKGEQDAEEAKRIEDFGKWLEEGN